MTIKTAISKWVNTHIIGMEPQNHALHDLNLKDPPLADWEQELLDHFNECNTCGFDKSSIHHYKECTS